MAGKAKQDIVNKRFGRAIALECVGSRGKNALWKCKCDCGNIFKTIRQSLLSGATKSCGCIQKEYRKSRIINPKKTVSCVICGKVFNHQLSRNPLTCSKRTCKQALQNKWRHKQKKECNFTYHICRIVASAKTRAKTKNLPCDISTKWVVEQCHKQDMRCAKTGIPFHLEKHSKRTPWSPSLDQIHPNKGYTKSNTQVVCQMYNFSKHIWEHNDVIEMAKYLVLKEKIDVKDIQETLCKE